jgi:hypothetical protein
MGVPAPTKNVPIAYRQDIVSGLTGSIFRPALSPTIRPLIREPDEIAT